MAMATSIWPRLMPVANTVSILLGQGDGTFARPEFGVGEGPFSVTAGDFNGDGRPDLATANFDAASVSILLGRGDGTFAAAPDFGGGTGSFITVGDFNGDGRLDLATANACADTVSILLGQGDGTFQAAQTWQWMRPVSVTVGDFNGDGHLDLATANANADIVSILLGQGDGTFEAVPDVEVGAGPLLSPGGISMAMATSDLATANLCQHRVDPAGPGRWHLCGRPGVWSGRSFLSIIGGRLRRRWPPDLATANANANVSVLLGQGDGTFSAAQDFAVGVGPESIIGATSMAMAASIWPMRISAPIRVNPDKHYLWSGGEQSRDLQTAPLHLHLYTGPQRVSHRLCGDLPLRGPADGRQQALPD